MHIPLDIKGWIKITDADTHQVLVDKSNAIHYENFSEALARSISAGPLNANDVDSANGFIKTMVFGNGGTDVSPTGVITYKTPNYVGSAATLYGATYSKVVNQNFANNDDTTNTNITVNHLVGKAYTDILISCLLNYTEPATNQPEWDNTTDFSEPYVFDELGLQSAGGKLLTHVIFHPVQKSGNRLIQIEYTIRIQTLTNLTTS